MQCRSTMLTGAGPNAARGGNVALSERVRVRLRGAHEPPPYGDARQSGTPSRSDAFASRRDSGTAASRPVVAIKRSDAEELRDIIARSFGNLIRQTGQFNWLLPISWQWRSAPHDPSRTEMTHDTYEFAKRKEQTAIRAPRDAPRLDRSARYRRAYCRGRRISALHRRGRY